ncbi:DMT family transporter [Litchfieldia salsa]|uniref:Threonine/homoserine efflux transporter RhtA n=1 Tax=Litchfieldia salsa TaxID=930152 RepID=A0A1H0VJG9_9BACI|nr:EamA family transporter [Litchfieldia salsa]SDP78729.1 Threonine/homoserine efflux transporter RhtA [Litchfieldia salsa]
MKKNLPLVYIGIGASLWGVIGVFVSYLYGLGLTPIQVVAIRVLTSSLFLLLYVSSLNRKLFKIKLSDSKFFIGTGIISIVFFNLCLFYAIQETSISIASILLYTAPAFVIILSRLFLKESFTLRKMIALFITLIGCSFVIGVFPNATPSISTYGLLLGLGSGFFYALYSIFGKYALKKYDSITVTLYTFIFAAVAITPFSGLWEGLHILNSPIAWFNILGLGFLSTTLAYILYTKGLSTVESGRASIIATIEPVVASLFSFMIFDEKLSIWQYMGISLVIIAVIVVQETTKKVKVNLLKKTINT